MFSVLCLHVVLPVVGLRSEETRNDMYLAKHVLSVILRSSKVDLSRSAEINRQR